MAQSKITQKDIAFGKKLAKIRKQKGLTQEQLAEKIHMTQTTIGLIEVGRRRPSVQTLNKLANALHIKVQELFPY